jgi:uncharacterized membrane protein YbhN (UPF0104 family)
MTISTVLLKLKILLQIIAVPILCAIILYFALPSHQPKINLLLIAAFIVGAFLRLVLVKRKYITRFSITGDDLIIHYLTPYLKTVELHFPVRTITGTEMNRRNWLSEKPAGVGLQTGQEWHRFHILDKALFDHVARLLEEKKLLRK